MANAVLRYGVVLALIVLFLRPVKGLAEEGGAFLERDTLTDSWFGLGNKLDERGVSLSFSLTQIYQRNTRGGLSTHRRSGELSGSYDAELEIDLAKLVGWPGGALYAAAEGSWREGIDGAAVGSVFGVNGDAAEDRSIDVVEVWFQQSFLDDAFQVRVGKMDLSGGFECCGCPVAFDGNSYANDETAQFLNSALVNNATIPFPDNGLGVAVFVNPVPWFYIGAGVGDAEADARETGFNTAFHASDNFFWIFETGVTPVIPTGNGGLPGAYRFGLWYDPQPKARFDGTGNERDDVGYYLSYDQMVWREGDGEGDAQGLGVFLRYGLADKAVNPVRTFWSAGGQYRGLIPTRDDDAIGFGMARGSLVRAAGFTAKNETVYEIYYNAAVAGWLTVTPSVQVVEHPGGVRGRSGLVAGVRAQLAL